MAHRYWDSIHAFKHERTHANRYMQGVSYIIRHCSTPGRAQHVPYTCSCIDTWQTHTWLWIWWQHTTRVVGLQGSSTTASSRATVLIQLRQFPSAAAMMQPAQCCQNQATLLCMPAPTLLQVTLLPLLFVICSRSYLSLTAITGWRSVLSPIMKRK